MSCIDGRIFLPVRFLIRFYFKFLAQIKRRMQVGGGCKKQIGKKAYWYFYLFNLRAAGVREGLRAGGGGRCQGFLRQKARIVEIKAV